MQKDIYLFCTFMSKSIPANSIPYVGKGNVYILLLALVSVPFKDGLDVNISGVEG